MEAGTLRQDYDRAITWQNITFSAPSSQKGHMKNSTLSSSNSIKKLNSLFPQDKCSSIQVAAGDSCSTLAAECGISKSELMQYNPSSTFCSSLEVGQHVCCSAGLPRDFTPQASSNGTCAAHLIAAGDICSTIATSNGITESDIEKYNTQTWGWMGCSDLQIGNYICISSGYPPLPFPIANAKCGPQVPGTPQPEHPGTNFSLLNTCPLNACCDIWGQCNVTTEYCTPSKSSTGAPGTAAPGQNGRISNCGTSIQSESTPPAQFKRIGYFEGYDWQRPCLRTDILSINTSAYTHTHLAFATLNPDFSINVTGIQGQLDAFVSLTGVQRIISFGGWAFSTDPSTYEIFREAVHPDNRATFATNVINFLNDNNLDGVDFDWEYPGEPDIKGIAPSSQEDMLNFYEFMATFRDNIITNDFGKSISVTAPASFWYLQNYPIAALQGAVDYIVYMTYDLHGQWDYNSSWSDPGCPAGNCLRSHVNLTETLNALSMITKAGLYSTHIVVGVASYGRSFQMTTPGCWTEMCTYTGPESGALPGKCTQQPGYLAEAEINSIIASSSNNAVLHMDTESYSNIMVYDSTQWVAYMDSANKEVHTSLYEALNFGGTIDWAIDLQTPQTGLGGGYDGDSGGEVYLPPDFWGSPSPFVVCAPPCTLIPPPLPLPTPTKVQWPPLITPIAVQQSGGSFTTTTTTTISFSTFDLVSVDVWPITILPGVPETVHWQPVQAITPPAVTITLPSSEAALPLMRSPAGLRTPSGSVSATSTGTISTSSTSAVAIFFPSTSHPITIQPLPTISFDFKPPLHTPTATYSSGSSGTSPSPTAKKHCSGCGDSICQRYGCNNGCGSYACDGGCGIQGCFWGCLIEGYGNTGGKGGQGGCSLEECGSPNCQDGSCGNQGCPDGNCGSMVSSLESCTQTATLCAEYCAVTTPANAAATTTCTATNCFPSIGCDSTGTTTTVFSTTTPSACPVVTLPITSYPPGVDVYGGCARCSWLYVAPMTSALNNRRQPWATPTPTHMRLDKRGKSKKVSEIASGSCILATAVTFPPYSGPADYITWYSKTESDCLPTFTAISDVAMKPYLPKGEYNLHGNSVQKPSIDHVYEKKFLDLFWDFCLNQGNDMKTACEQLNHFVFPAGCNLLQPVYDSVASNKFWDFIGFTQDLNTIKGDLSLGRSHIETLAKKALRSLESVDDWGQISDSLTKEQAILRSFVLGCDMWTSKLVQRPLDITNNRIYNALNALEEIGPNIAQSYRAWMPTYLQDMLTSTNDQIALIVADMRTKLSETKAAAIKSGSTENWESYQRVLKSIVDEHYLDTTGNTNRCLRGIALSWTLNNANSRRQEQEMELLARDTCSTSTSTRTFYIFTESNQKDTGLGVQYLVGFDLDNTQSDYGALCDSGYQVTQPYSWQPSEATGVPPIGPFDLKAPGFTGCMYSCSDPSSDGTLTCDGGYSWPCTLDPSYPNAAADCSGTELYTEVYCDYTF